MAVENDADRSIFFDTDDFGGVATIHLNDGTTFDVEGIYDGPNVVRGVRQDNQFTAASSADLASQSPRFRTRSSVLPGVKNGRATIVIHEPFFADPTTFEIWNVGPDGTGMTLLTLKRA